METVETVPSIPDYTLLRRIGGGSYGDVWLGRSVTGIYRAIKIVSRARFADERPFWRELEGITRFQQGVGDEPRQLALLHVGELEQAKAFYYVMELADDAVFGSEIDPDTYVPLTLRELRARRRCLPAADCVRMGTELAIALQDLHEAGLLHRDVKPSNIILVDGRAKLADIGLITSTDVSMTMVGTPAYAPPEGGGSVRADLYSLGKVLYELATGLRADEYPRLPSDLAARPDAELLLELNEIILRACHAESAQRYQSAEKLLSDLRLLQAGGSVQELNRTRRQLRRLVWVGAVAGVCGVVALTVLGVRNYLTVRALERLASYASDLHFAQIGLANGDFGVTRTALRRQVPKPGEKDRRGLEWYAFWNESEGQAATVLGEIGDPPIHSVCVSPDGQLLALAVATGDPLDRVRVFDVASGAQRLAVPDCYDLVGFTRDGSRLFFTTGDKEVAALDLITARRKVWQTRGYCLEMARDDRVTLVDPETLEIFSWDMEKAQESPRWKPEPAHAGAGLSAAAIDRERGRLAAGFLREAEWRGEAVLHNLVREVDVRLPDLPPVDRMQYSPDGRRLAIAAGAAVLICDSDTTDVLVRIPTGAIRAVFDFSPDGALLATAGDDRLLKIWSTSDAKELASFAGHEKAIAGVRWMQDGRRVVTGSVDGTCRIWDVQRELSPTIYAGLWSNELGSITFNAAGTLLAGTSSAGNVVLLDSKHCRVLRTIEDAFLPLAFSADGRTLFSLSHAPEFNLVRSDVGDGRTSHTGVQLPDESSITAYARSPDKRLAAIGLISGSVEVWDLSAATRVWAGDGPNSSVLALAISNDGHVASAWGSGPLRIAVAPSMTWADIPTEGPVVTGLGFSGDARFLAAGYENGHLLVWNVEESKPEATAEAHSTEVRCVLFTPDRSRLLTAGGDGLIVAWDTERWRPVSAWSISAGASASPRPICQLDISASGSWLAAMTDDGLLKLWNCEPDRPAPAKTPELQASQYQTDNDR